MIMTAATSTDEATRAASVAVLPVGSFEQHGSHLPLVTDTIVACLITSRLAEDYDLFLLPPLTIGCSHEHATFAGTVSISASTLHLLVREIATDLVRQGVPKLVIVNAHGGNYVLSNLAQESNASEARVLLYPGRVDWDHAREAAACVTGSHDDMHGGELETSLLLYATPELVDETWATADVKHPIDPNCCYWVWPPTPAPASSGPYQARLPRRAAASWTMSARHSPAPSSSSWAGWPRRPIACS